MAKPRYIVCAKDLLIDQFSGLNSHINIVDKLDIRKISPEPSADAPVGTPVLIPRIPIAQLILTASWVKGPEDSEKDLFEFETILHKTDGASDVIRRGEFQFIKRFYRIDTGIIFTTESKFERSGEIVLECRIRKVGSEDWISQSFPLDVEVSIETKPVEESANQIAE